MCFNAVQWVIFYQPYVKFQTQICSRFLSMQTKQFRDGVFVGCCLGILFPLEGMERRQAQRRLLNMLKRSGKGHDLALTLYCLVGITALSLSLQRISLGCTLFVTMNFPRLRCSCAAVRWPALVRTVHSTLCMGQ